MSEVSPETKEKLIKTFSATIEELWPLVLISVSAYESFRKDLDSNTFSNDLIPKIKQAKALHRLNYLTLFTSVDLAVILKAELTTSDNAARRCLLRFANVIIRESVSAFGGFGKTKKQAFKELENAFPSSEDKAIIEQLKKALESYSSLPEDNFGINKEYRDLSVHYDHQSIRAYDYFSSISEETECQRICAFIKILQEDVMPIINKRINLLGVVPVSTKRFVDINKDELPLIDQIGLLQFSSYEIIQISISLAKMKTQYANINYLKSIDFRLLIPYAEMESSLNLQTFLQLINLDVLVMLNACIRSKTFIEKVLLLRRVNVFIYEGVKKLIGYTAEERAIAFWPNYLRYQNSSVHRDIENQLIKFALEQDDQLRNYSVHYYDNSTKQDNIYELINGIFEMSIRTEQHRAHDLLKITKQISKQMADDTEKKLIHIANI